MGRMRWVVPYALSGACRRSMRARVVLSALVVFAVPAAGAAAPAEAAAKQVRVQVRVIDSADRQLVDAVVHSSSTRVRTSPDALCFGEGTGGSGKLAPTAVRGPNAMGVLADAAMKLSVLRPLEVSDYYSYGQTLCAIGGVEAVGLFYWAVWIGDTFVESSADNARVRSAQTVIYHLTDEYPSTDIPAPLPRVSRRPVVGAPGSFPITGTASSDRVLARDGKRDRIRCSEGDDLVFADRSDRISADCEEVRRG